MPDKLHSLDGVDVEESAKVSMMRVMMIRVLTRGEKRIPYLRFYGSH